MSRARAATRLRMACAAAIVIAAASAAQGATLQVSSATVANSGDSARICVSLSTNGQQVAGTQNDLTWDGNCASLSDESACAVAGSHGKQLSPSTQLHDFWLRALILSLTNTDPIPDGLLYCCNFQSEADPGQCCAINISNTGASDPTGKALAATGRGGQLCTANSTDQAGRGIGSLNNGQPLSANNAPPVDAGGPMGQSGAAAAAAGAAAARPPAAQVLQGGGEHAANAPNAVVEAPTAPPLQAPTAPAAPAPTAPAPPATVAQRPIAPATTAPTVAPTQAAAAPAQAAAAATQAPKDTPTRRLFLQATAVATKVAPGAKQAAGEPLANASGGGGGWFGCQVADGASAAPAVTLGLLALIGALIRRRSTSHIQRSRGGYGDDA